MSDARTENTRTTVDWGMVEDDTLEANAFAPSSSAKQVNHLCLAGVKF